MIQLQHGWLDGALIGVMVIGIVGTLYHRIRLDFGIGNRAIQFVGMCLVVPTVLILGLEDKISKENMGTILGAIIGYILSGIGSSDQKKQKDKTGSEKEDAGKEQKSSN